MMTKMPAKSGESATTDTIDIGVGVDVAVVVVEAEVAEGTEVERVTVTAMEVDRNLTAVVVERVIVTAMEGITITIHGIMVMTGVTAVMDGTVATAAMAVDAEENTTITIPTTTSTGEAKEVTAQEAMESQAVAS